MTRDEYKDYIEKRATMPRIRYSTAPPKRQFGLEMVPNGLAEGKIPFETKASEKNNN